MQLCAPSSAHLHCERVQRWRHVLPAQGEAADQEPRKACVTAIQQQADSNALLVASAPRAAYPEGVLAVSSSEGRQGAGVMQGSVVQAR